MKKLYLLLILICFTITQQAQTFVIDKPLKIKGLTEGIATDSLLTINPQGYVSYFSKSLLQTKGNFVTLDTPQYIEASKFFRGGDDLTPTATFENGAFGNAIYANSNSDSTPAVMVYAPGTTGVQSSTAYQGTPYVAIVSDGEFPPVVSHLFRGGKQTDYENGIYAAEILTDGTFVGTAFKHPQGTGTKLWKDDGTRINISDLEYLPWLKYDFTKPKTIFDDIYRLGRVYIGTSDNSNTIGKLVVNDTAGEPNNYLTIAKGDSQWAIWPNDLYSNSRTLAIGGLGSINYGWQLAWNADKVANTLKSPQNIATQKVLEIKAQANQTADIFGITSATGAFGDIFKVKADSIAVAKGFAEPGGTGNKVATNNGSWKPLTEFMDATKNISYQKKLSLNNPDDYGLYMSNDDEIPAVFGQNLTTATSPIMTLATQSGNIGGSALNISNTAVAGTAMTMTNNSNTREALYISNFSNQSGKGLIINAYHTGTGNSFESRNNTVPTMTVSKEGNIVANSLTVNTPVVVSDVRTKTNFIDTGLTKTINGNAVKIYTYIRTFDGSTDIGLKAQDVEAALSGLPENVINAIVPKRSGIDYNAFISAINSAYNLNTTTYQEANFAVVKKIVLQKLKAAGLLAIDYNTSFSDYQTLSAKEASTLTTAEKTRLNKFNTIDWSATAEINALIATHTVTDMRGLNITALQLILN